MSQRLATHPGLPEYFAKLEGVHDLGARFVSRTSDSRFFPYAEVLARARSVAATLQRMGLRPGDRVAIMLPTSIEFLDAFFGTMLAGGVPTALYPPLQLGKAEQHLTRSAAMLRRIGAKLIISDDKVGQCLLPLVAAVPTIETLLQVTELRGDDPWTPMDLDPQGPAFLQFTSGSTAVPRAVVVSHANLLSNLEMLGSRFRHLDSPALREGGGVCWLPLYHDMGLVGCLFYGLHHPVTVTYLRPESFLAKPQAWFEALSRYRAVISPAPNFAYELCLAKIRDAQMEGLDLSHWRVALNGAEPVNTRAMRDFIERFARWGLRASTMTPVYGLAEAVLAVSFSEVAAPPVVTEFDRDGLETAHRAEPGSGRSLASVGTAMAGLEIRVADKDGNALVDGHVGRLLVRGGSVFSGYFNDPEASHQVLDGEWLDTGDLGFFHDGQLYISGRAKDLLIIRGRNIAPQEIEALVGEIEGIRSGRVVAIGVPLEDRGEQLVILAERQIRGGRDAVDIERDIMDALLSGSGLRPYRIQLLKPGTLPRTSSGKLQRSAALDLYLNGRL